MRFLLPMALAIALTGCDMNAHPVQSSANKYRSFGVGVVVSCGTWIALRRQSEATADPESQWLLGFLAGASFAGQSYTLDGPAVMAWLDNYCRAYPLDSLSQAGGAFVTAHPLGTR
jgi:hypothetical protein